MIRTLCTKKNLVISLLLLSACLVALYALIKHTTTDTSHAVGTSQGEKVHVHADFRMYIDDERIRFTDEKYQSSTAHTHHVSLHFHDGNDEVIHRHAEGGTLTEFFESIDIILTNSCLTMDTGPEYCTNDTADLILLVNGKRIDDIDNYIFAEEDRILLYYGNPSNPKLNDYIANITDLSCIYSGTCPERGAPPTESCGLTCEVSDLATDSQSFFQKLSDFIGKYALFI
jgi:hypothetical protein